MLLSFFIVSCRYKNSMDDPAADSGIIISLPQHTFVNVSNLYNSIPSQIKIPYSNVILDLSFKGEPFQENGYINIHISGNSFKLGEIPTPLNPYKSFNPLLYGNNSTQIFIDEMVINRLVEAFISDQGSFNYTHPQILSSTTPFDSYSLSAVFPGLRKLDNIHYPTIEAILNSTSIKINFSDNKLKGKVVVGLNLYMQEANKPNTMFKYNNKVVYVVSEVAINILNSKNFLTLNLDDIQILKVKVSPEDVPLVDVQQIESVSMFYSQIIHDSLNIRAYKNYLDLSKFLGLDISQVSIDFQEDYIHFTLIQN